MCFAGLQLYTEEPQLKPVYWQEAETDAEYRHRQFENRRAERERNKEWNKHRRPGERTTGGIGLNVRGPG